ncbi:MAG: hypothetical protein NW214_01175 [Pseudanabaenaceae cyanobacterium bins.39]|nr:hypothetical protein [Pseudanabaenaceae cyanobacterium bins.39]
MSDTVIKVENLSKRYVIGHQAQTLVRYIGRNKYANALKAKAKK